MTNRRLLPFNLFARPHLHAIVSPVALYIRPRPSVDILNTRHFFSLRRGAGGGREHAWLSRAFRRLDEVTTIDRASTGPQATNLAQIANSNVEIKRWKRWRVSSFPGERVQFILVVATRFCNFTQASSSNLRFTNARNAII